MSGAVSVGIAAAAAAVVTCWLPIFQVGGFIYRIVEEHRGRAYAVAAAIVPLGVALVALSAGRMMPWAARAAALAGLLVATLAPVDHLSEALWRRNHPERFGSPFDLRYGYVVGLLAVACGVVVAAILIGELLADGGSRPTRLRTDVFGLLAALGLLVAVAGQLAESSTAHLWQLPFWPQVGRWWRLIVTTSVAALAVLRRRGPALAAGFVIALTSTIASAERLSAYSALEDDPAVSSTIVVAGFAILTAGLASVAAGRVRGVPRR